MKKSGGDASHAILPEEALTAFGVFIQEKFHEHFHTTLHVAMDEGAGRKAEDCLSLVPVEICEPPDMGTPERVRLDAKPGNGLTVGVEKNPPLALQVTCLLAFESDRLVHGAVGLMRLRQILKEYRVFKAGDESLNFQVVTDIAFQEQLWLWQSLGRCFKPGIFCRLNLCLEPIRQWEIKLAQQKVVKTYLKEESAAPAS